MERSSDSRKSERFGVSQRIVLTHEEATMMTEIAGGNTRFFVDPIAAKALLRIMAKLTDVKYFTVGKIDRIYLDSGSAIITGLGVDANEVADAIRRGEIVIRD